MQGSILGPDLWNVNYNGIISCEILDELNKPIIIDMKTITETLRKQKVGNYLDVRLDSWLTY